jgi:nicotinamidase-related amidase
MERAHALEIPRTLQDICRPDRMGVVVYDMQVGILRQLTDGGGISQRVGRVLEAARAGGFRVVFTRHLSMPPELMGVSQMRTAMAWQHVDSPDAVVPWFPRDSDAFQIVPELSPRPSEAILDKVTMSAFEGTPLGIVLRDCGLIAVAVLGVAMEVGIEPTVRHAADVGFIPVVVADACGAGSREAAERSLASLTFAGDAVMTESDVICPLLRAG